MSDKNQKKSDKLAAAESSSEKPSDKKKKQQRQIFECDECLRFCVLDLGGNYPFNPRHCPIDGHEFNKEKGWKRK